MARWAPVLIFLRAVVRSAAAGCEQHHSAAQGTMTDADLLWKVKSRIEMTHKVSGQEAVSGTWN